MICIMDSMIGILISMFIIVVSVVFECMLNSFIVVVIVSLKKLLVLISVDGLVM